MNILDVFSKPPRFGVVSVIGVGVLVRIAAFRGLLYDHSAQVAKVAWELFSAPQGSSLDLMTLWLKDALRTIRDLPSDIRVFAPLLGLTYRVFGVSNFTSLLLLIILGTSGVLLIYFLARNWFHWRAGVIAGFFWAVLPTSVFLSANLLPTLFLIVWDLFVIFLFVWAKDKNSRLLFCFSALLLGLGLLSDLSIFLPTAVLLVCWFLYEHNVKGSTHWQVVVLLLALVFFMTKPWVNVSNVYYQLLLPFDNLWILPLLAVGLVFAAGHQRHKAIDFLVIWLSVKTAFVFLAAPWLVQLPGSGLIGMTGFWLTLVTPALILFGWQISAQIGENASKAILWVTLLASFWYLAMILTNAEYDHWLYAGSRIALGFSILGALLYIVLSKGKTATGAVFFCLLAIAFASPAVVQMYVREEAESLSNTEEAYLLLLAQEPAPHRVFAGGDLLYERLWLLQTSRLEATNDSLTILPLDQHLLEEAELGDYVIAREPYVRFVLGAIPGHWQALNQAEDEPQFLLFRITEAP